MKFKLTEDFIWDLKVFKFSFPIFCIAFMTCLTYDVGYAIIKMIRRC